MNKQLENIARELEAISNREDADYTFYDWIPENVKSTNYVINEDGNYIAVQLCLSFDKYKGGSNVFIYTDTMEIRAFSENGNESIKLSQDVCDELDEIYFDFYNEEPDED
jgi:hypothetical protein